MTRAFRRQALDPTAVERIVAAGMRAPSAGNSQGLDLLVVEDPPRYWDATFPASRREGFRFPKLFDAPLLIVLWAEPAAYVARYAAPDKVTSRLGSDAAAWPVPYWHVDAGMAAMLIQLAAIDEGYGTLFFGVFDRAAELRAAFGVPGDRIPVGTIAVGQPEPDDTPGRSAGRPRRSDAIHRGVW